jgi:hypothetical protein
LAAPVAAEVVKASEASDEAIPGKHPGPFADVPVNHPAYAALAYLSRAGFVIGYPDGAFSGKQARTRYEFSVAVQRLNADYQRGLDIVRSARFELSALPPGKKELRSTRTLVSPEGRRNAAVWIRVLVSEFRRELTMLGSDPEVLLTRLSAQEDEATAASVLATEHPKTT